MSHLSNDTHDKLTNRIAWSMRYLWHTGDINDDPLRPHGVEPLEWRAKRRGENPPGTFAYAELDTNFPIDPQNKTAR